MSDLIHPLGCFSRLLLLQKRIMVQIIRPFDSGGICRWVSLHRMGKWNGNGKFRYVSGNTSAIKYKCLLASVIYSYMGGGWTAEWFDCVVFTTSQRNIFFVHFWHRAPGMLGSWTFLGGNSERPTLNGMQCYLRQGGDSVFSPMSACLLAGWFISRSRRSISSVLLSKAAGWVDDL